MEGETIKKKYMTILDMLKKERLTFGNQIEGLEAQLRKQEEEIEKLKVSHLGVIWLSSVSHMGVIWSHLEVIWESFESSVSQMEVIWERCGSHLGVIWEAYSSGSDLEVIWKSCGSHLRVIWESNWSYLGVISESSGSRLVNTWEMPGKCLRFGQAKSHPFGQMGLDGHALLGQPSKGHPCRILIIFP